MKLINKILGAFACLALSLLTTVPCFAADYNFLAKEYDNRNQIISAGSENTRGQGEYKIDSYKVIDLGKERGIDNKSFYFVLVPTFKCGKITWTPVDNRLFKAKKYGTGETYYAALNEDKEKKTRFCCSFY